MFRSWWGRSTTASPTEPGLIQPDNTSIVLSDAGILSAAAGPGAAVTAVTGVAPIVSSGGLTPAISIAEATTVAPGAVQPDGVTIGVSGGVISTLAGIVIASLTLSAAQINGMFAAPIQIIAAPGPGKAIRVLNTYWNAIFGGAAFTGGGNMNLFYGNVSPPVTAAGSSLGSAFLTTFSANQINASQGVPASGSTSNSAIAVNAPLFVANITAPFAGGTGSTMTVRVVYCVLPAQ